MSDKQRLRISFDADTNLERRTLAIAAVMRGTSVKDVLNGLIRTGLPEFLEQARANPEAGIVKRRGRKPARTQT
jgi:hypothetical protein